MHLSVVPVFRPCSPMCSLSTIITYMRTKVERRKTDVRPGRLIILPDKDKDVRQDTYIM